MKRVSTRYMVLIALIAAISVVLMWFQFPLLPAAPFLEYDFSDTPVLIGSFALGPVAGFLIATIKAAVFLLTKGQSGPIGAFMNWVSTAIFVVIASVFYHYVSKTRWGALAGMLLGTAVFTAAMVYVNIYIALPMWGIPTEQISGLIKSAVIPFNLLRGVISSAVTFVLYKKVSLVIKDSL